MAWAALTVEWTKAARRDLRGLTAKDRAQIEAAVHTFAATGHGDVKKLKDVQGYRIRVRERRVLVTIVWSDRVTLVGQVSTRGDAYRHLFMRRTRGKWTLAA